MHKMILVPLSGAQASERVIDWARKELAPGGSLILLQVIPSETSQPEVGGSGRSQQVAVVDNRARALEYLTDVLRRHGGDSDGWRCEVVLNRSVPDGIVEFAAGAGVDLIAMWTHGRTGLMRILAGSVTRDVERKAPCEVRAFRAQELQQVA